MADSFTLHNPDDVVIRVDDLYKHYGDLKAVDGVSFGVARGEVFGILGPNGAGKTTTLSCLEGLEEPTSGSTSVLGLNVQQNPTEAKERIGVQLQASAYFDYLTLREILTLFGRFYKTSALPDELLERVNLLERADTTLNKLSGGQQQRFTIAAALVNNPEVVFLDEPTTGLDPQARRNLWRFIQAINEGGRTVVLTTHYMEEAEYLCDRIAVMDRGKIVALDTPANLISALPIPYEIRIAVRDSRDRSIELGALAGIESAVADGDGAYHLGCTDASVGVSAVSEWARMSGVSITHLEVVASNLEDVFLSITGHELRE